MLYLLIESTLMALAFCFIDLLVYRFCAGIGMATTIFRIISMTLHYFSYVR